MSTIDALPPAPSTSSPSTFDTLADAFVAALATFRTQTNTVAGEVVTNAAAAAASAAVLAAAQSSLSADSTGSSTSSVAIGSGSKSFTTQSGKSWVAGMTLLVYYDASNYLRGVVATYSGTSLTITVPTAGAVGSGTYAVWAISPAPAVMSVDGATGAVTTVNVRVVSAAATAVAKDYIVVTAFCDITLPASATVGDRVVVDVARNIGYPRVLANGLKIMGFAQDLTLDIPGPTTFLYASAALGWRVSKG